MILQNIILHLSLIEDLTPRFLHELISKISFEKLIEVYGFSVQDFVALGCGPDKAQLLVCGLQNQQRLIDELKLIQENDAAFITFFCDEYPNLLKHIDVPPLVLYYQGDVSLFAKEKTFACVGARKSHLYVHDALKVLITPMIQDDWVIVSGGAAGADTYAHQITLDNKGKTIMVVGSGLCYRYPTSNKDLFEQVVYDGGLIVSVFHMEMPPEPYCFPIRNRIISGLSLGCLVLQAAQKSGALITAHCALQQGREVFALPGSIFDPLSVGCHDLIQQGAKLVTNTQDILQELSYPGKPDFVQMSILADAQMAEKKAKASSKVVPSSSASIQTVSGQAVSSRAALLKSTTKSKMVDVAAYEGLDDLSRAIMHCTVTPITSQALLSKVEATLEVLQNKLFELSLEGKITQDGMGMWKRV